MRGYRLLRCEHRLECLGKVKRELTQAAFEIDSAQVSDIIFGAATGSAELAVRQYLLAQLVGKSFNLSLLSSVVSQANGMSYGMPNEWIDILERNGFPVSRFQCSVRWRVKIIKFWLLGFYRFVKACIQSIRSDQLLRDRLHSYAYFDGLTHTNLPAQTNATQELNILSWYEQWNGRDAGVSSLGHSVETSVCTSINSTSVHYQQEALLPLRGFSEWGRFCGWMVQASLLTLIDLLRGRWWNVVMLNQAVYSAKARTLPHKTLACQYLFHNSNWIYRPLWTYEAEKRGSSLVFYFYSTNIQMFNGHHECMPPPFGWKAANWPHYLVWDEFQSDFIASAISPTPQISVVGHIWFGDAVGSNIDLSGSGIAVFDVQPFREAVYRGLALEYEYYTPATALAFLNDVHDVLSEFELDMLFKRKRETHRMAHPQYRGHVKSLETDQSVLLVTPNTSAVEVVKQSIGVISMPFTSTALLGQIYGKPSVYYDALNQVQKGDCAAHGIPVLIGKKELKQWVADLVSKSQTDIQSL